MSPEDGGGKPVPLEVGLSGTLELKAGEVSIQANLVFRTGAGDRLMSERTLELFGGEALRVFEFRYEGTHPGWYFQMDSRRLRVPFSESTKILGLVPV
ncbi:MAG: hypothetical protein ABIE03_00915 [Patescibacteria group bacterium]|nr:hypothetical protein [Patescibacteria group bacterium]